MAANGAAGDYAGPHTEKHIGQHRATLDDDARDAAGLREALVWFRTLPVAIEDPGWRCVHACWDPGKLDRLAREDDA